MARLHMRALLLKAVATVAIVLVGACLALCLNGCSSPGTITRDRTVEVKVPVAQPCAKARPAPVKQLKEQLPRDQWRGLDVKQKAARVGKQGLDRQTYGEQLDAATGGCPEIQH